MERKARDVHRDDHDRNPLCRSGDPNMWGGV
jgi:hypothetical protein